MHNFSCVGVQQIQQQEIRKVLLKVTIPGSEEKRCFFREPVGLPRLNKKVKKKKGMSPPKTHKYELYLPRTKLHRTAQLEYPLTIKANIKK